MQPLGARQSKLVISSNRRAPISPQRNNPVRAFAKNDGHYLWSAIKLRRNSLVNRSRRQSRGKVVRNKHYNTLLRLMSARPMGFEDALFHRNSIRKSGIIVRSRNSRNTSRLSISLNVANLVCTQTCSLYKRAINYPCHHPSLPFAVALSRNYS